MALYNSLQIHVPECCHAAEKNVSLKLWNLKGLLKLRCPIFSFVKVVLINKYVPEPAHATVKYFNNFSKFRKLLKMDVSHKNAS